MPVSGGASGKEGDWYELLWAADRLLNIIDGQSVSLTLEELDIEGARGVEFRLVNRDNTVEYWSIKRQTTTAAGWTLATLTARNDHGRSILGDLLTHVERDPSNTGVFASTLGAYSLDELSRFSASKSLFDDRLRRSEKGLRKEFERYILPLCGGNVERARAFLLRARSETMSHDRLRETVGFAARKLLYAVDGSPIDVAAVRGHLGDLLEGRMHRLIDRGDILAALEAHGIRPSNWAIDVPVRERLADLREAYLGPLRSQLIGGSVLPLSGSEGILTTDGQPAHRRTLVVGTAGGGKSSTMLDIVDRLTAAGIPVLPIRFDELPDGLVGATDLGRRKLRLPESPAIVLANVSGGRPCVLVVDQLDAVSTASGRRVEQWALFEDLLREANRLANLSIVVGCRAFDLEHDHRMRSLKADGAGFHVAQLEPLTDAQVDAAAGEGQPIAASLRAVLRVPLHLWMFLTLPILSRSGVVDRDDVFAQFWETKRRAVDARLARPAEWPRIIARLTNWLSDRQTLSAPRRVLDDDFAVSDVAALVSEAVLILADGQYRFFHESFFDYAFARQFVNANGRVVDLLVATEQHLFRRAQVRQILT